MSGLRVFIVDDQASVRRALGRLFSSLDYAVAEFESADAFLASGMLDQPGCVVLDLAMPGMNGLALQQALLDAGSDLPAVFLSGAGSIAQTVQAMQQGAIDFLTKPADDETLLAAVQRAIARNASLRAARAERDAVLACLASLTAREREVLDQVLTGRLNKQIADALGTAEKTVKTHRGKVMAKMGVRSVAELVRLCGRVEPDGTKVP